MAKSTIGFTGQYYTVFAVALLRTNTAARQFALEAAFKLLRPGARFWKVAKSFRTRKAVAKSPTLWLQSCFIHIFLVWTEVPFVQDISGVYTSPFVDKDKLNMALRARKVSGAYEKQAPVPLVYV